MIILCDVILVYVKLNTAITTPPPTLSLLRWWLLAISVISYYYKKSTADTNQNAVMSAYINIVIILG